MQISDEMVRAALKKSPKFWRDYHSSEDHMRSALEAALAVVAAKGMALVPVGLLDQHVAWLRVFVGEMTPENWRDMQLRASKQLDDVAVMIAAARLLPSSPKMEG